jgi:hypothetical protein
MFFAKSIAYRQLYEMVRIGRRFAPDDYRGQHNIDLTTPSPKNYLTTPSEGHNSNEN